jgi:aryl-alcohol dehydrogenase-like predicted oxidoreductase
MATDCLNVELAPGYSIAPIINGCWQLTPDHGGGPNSRKRCLHRFAELVEHGFTTFDCADIYEGTEELLGEFRRSLTEPEKIQVHTKLVPNKNALADLDDRLIDLAIDSSRSKLGVDTLDLVQFHWWDYEVDGLDRLYDRLLHAQSAGKIRLLGVTNFNTAQLRNLLSIDESLVAMQAQYSLLDRRPEREMVECCIAHDVKLMPYGGLSGGFLSDRYLGQSPPASMNRSLQKYRLIIDEAGGWEHFQELLGQMAEIAEKHATSIAAVAARWVLDQAAVSAVIVGIGTQSRVASNLALCGLRLDEQDQECIARALSSLRIPPGDPYDMERDTTGVLGRIIRTELQTPGETR